ncbi:hypothetical protein GGI07_001370 [Coemansia sp. Benny D115]|nr:hypothetical protein GGI07_001370 [Coemansia sp. Benny D115]
MFSEISRGYLPAGYFEERKVYKRKPPQLELSPYPNKIEVDQNRSYAIISKKTDAKLQDIFAWMSTHPYVMVYYTGQAGQELTGNVAVEAYESPVERGYAMVTFRAATSRDELTNYMMQSKGDSSRRGGACPAPATGLLCRSAVNIQSVWQWLSLHRGRLAYVTNEPLITTNSLALGRRPFVDYSSRVPLASNGGGYSSLQGAPSGGYSMEANLQQYLSRNLPARRYQSRESLDSMLPVYEPPKTPSIHPSIPEDTAERAALSPGEEEEERNNDSDDEGEGEGRSNVAGSSHGAHRRTAAPPSYGDVAQDTEYGRTFAANLAAAAASTIFGSSSRYLIDHAAATMHQQHQEYQKNDKKLHQQQQQQQPTAVLSRTRPVAEQADQADISGNEDPAAAHALTNDATRAGAAVVAATTAMSEDVPNVSSAAGGSHMEDGSIMSSSSSVSMAVSMTMDLGNGLTGYCRGGNGFARTFTQSMPMLNKLLCDDEDAVAVIEESRLGAIVTATISNNMNAVRIVERTVTGAAEETLGFVAAANAPPPLERSSQDRDSGSGSSGHAPVGGEDLDGLVSVPVTGATSATTTRTTAVAPVVSLAVVPDASVSFGQGNNGTTLSHNGGLQGPSSTPMPPSSSSGSLLRSINTHVRRSRLASKTNPEYGNRSGKKGGASGWLTRLLNI